VRASGPLGRHLQLKASRGYLEALRKFATN
jgi:hypothetical protein